MKYLCKPEIMYEDRQSLDREYAHRGHVIILWLERNGNAEELKERRMAANERAKGLENAIDILSLAPINYRNDD